MYDNKRGTAPSESGFDVSIATYQVFLKKEVYMYFKS